MAGKISELTELAEAPHDDDELEVLDASATDNKRVKQKYLRGHMGPAGTALEVSSNAITVSHWYHRVEAPFGEGGELITTINGGVEGMRVVLQYSGSNTAPTLAHGTGNIRTKDGQYIYMSLSDMVVELIYDGTAWQVLSVSINTGV